MQRYSGAQPPSAHTATRLWVAFTMLHEFCKKKKKRKKEKGLHSYITLRNCLYLLQGLWNQQNLYTSVWVVLVCFKRFVIFYTIKQSFGLVYSPIRIIVFWAFIISNGGWHASCRSRPGTRHSTIFALSFSLLDSGIHTDTFLWKNKNDPQIILYSYVDCSVFPRFIFQWPIHFAKREYLI